MNSFDHPLAYVARRWLVLFFDPAGLSPFWRALTRRGYAHVNLLHYDATRHIWIYLDWGRNGASLSWILPAYVHLLLERVLDSGGAVLEWTTPAVRPPQSHFNLPHCVHFAQRFLGIPGFFLRPDHLAAWLRGAGAKDWYAGAYGPEAVPAYAPPESQEEPAHVRRRGQHASGSADTSRGQIHS